MAKGTRGQERASAAVAAELPRKARKPKAEVVHVTVTEPGDVTAEEAIAIVAKYADLVAIIACFREEPDFPVEIHEAARNVAFDIARITEALAAGATRLSLTDKRYGDPPEDRRRARAWLELADIFGPEDAEPYKRVAELARTMSESATEPSAQEAA